MEHSLIATGIGGQGIQLGAQTLARAAIRDHRDVMMFGSYGGMMRGGSTDATLVLADGPIDTPPVIAHCWLAIAMHHEYLATALDKLVDTSVLFVNSSVVTTLPETPATVIELPATDLAVDSAALVCATMVMVGAVCAATGLVSAAALDEGLREALPSYRSSHVDVNLAALSAGRDAALELARPREFPQAWSER